MLKRNTVVATPSNPKPARPTPPKPKPPPEPLPPNPPPIPPKAVKTTLRPSFLKTPIRSPPSNNEVLSGCVAWRGRPPTPKGLKARQANAYYLMAPVSRRRRRRRDSETPNSLAASSIVHRIGRPASRSACACAASLAIRASLSCASRYSW